MLCRTQALLAQPAQQWEDLLGAVTHSHANPNVFTESRRLKGERVFHGFPKPKPGALKHQPFDWEFCLAFNPQARGAFGEDEQQVDLIFLNGKIL